MGNIWKASCPTRLHIPCPHPRSLHAAHIHTPEYSSRVFWKHIANTSEPLQGVLAGSCSAWRTRSEACMDLLPNEETVHRQGRTLESHLLQVPSYVHSIKELNEVRIKWEGMILKIVKFCSTEPLHSWHPTTSPHPHLSFQIISVPSSAGTWAH